VSFLANHCKLIRWNSSINTEWKYSASEPSVQLDRVWNYLLTNCRQPDLPHSHFRQLLKTFSTWSVDQSTVQTPFNLCCRNTLTYLLNDHRDTLYYRMQIGRHKNTVIQSEFFQQVPCLGQNHPDLGHTTPATQKYWKQSKSTNYMQYILN